MTLLDPAERALRGSAIQSELTGTPAGEPTTLVEGSWRDFVYAEVWSRPGLDRRSRFWISMSAAVFNPRSADALAGYIRGALTLEEVTLAELREAALHAAVYGGWPCGTYWDEAITRVATQLGLAPVAFEPIQPHARMSAERRQTGFDGFRHIMTFPIGAQGAPYFEVGNLNFVVPEMWLRPGLDMRARRWISFVASAESASGTVLQSHVYAALKREEMTLDEANEFVLHYAAECGWPKAAMAQAAVMTEARKVSENLPYN